MNNDSWIAKNWRPMAAIVYFIICLCDFVVMPIYCEATSNIFTPEAITNIISNVHESGAQVEALKVIHDYHPWQPITLGEDGLLHVSFGAILGVSAWMRGKEKIETIKNINTDKSNA